MVRMALTRAGCNIMPFEGRVRAVAVLRGRPNSPDADVGPVILVYPVPVWPPVNPNATNRIVPACTRDPWRQGSTNGGAQVRPPYLTLTTLFGQGRAAAARTMLPSI